MRNTVRLVIAALALFTTLPIHAQGRLLTGTVVDSAVGNPLEGTQVSLRGTSLGAVAGTDGRFAIQNAPDGALVLQIRRIGYRAAERTVASGETDLRIALVRDPLELDEVIVTGQATSIERRNAATAIATVSGEEVSRVAAPSIETALQGKVVGAVIQSNSGAPGGGIQVQMRGVTSINAASEPLYVVDGVVMSNDAIPSNLDAVTKSAGGANGSVQDGAVNRIADLNPNEIESIEFLKGASAAAIYGSRAANGVVVITTKRGTVGAPRFSLTQRLGVAQISNTLGSREFKTLDEAIDVWGPEAANFFQPGRTFDHEEQLSHRKPLLTETVLDLSGGTENTQYYVSGLWKEDGGIIDNTGFEKQSLRANVDQKLGSRVDLDVGLNVTRSRASRGVTNNDNAAVSYYVVLPFTPSFVDLSQAQDGTFPCNPFIGNCSNPLQTAALSRNDETVWRYFGSARLGISAVQTPTQTLRFSLLGGADFFNQENDLFFPPELFFEGDDGEPGTVLLSNTHNLNLNVGANAVHSFTPLSGRFTATTSVGAAYSERELDLSRITSRNIVGGLDVVGAGTNVQVIGTRQRVETASLFAQEELLLFNERMLLTAGVNADQTSANSDDQKLYIYPKLSGSYRFVAPLPGLDEFKLRAAFGESGNEPLYGQKFTPLGVRQNISGLPAIITQGVISSGNLRPERQREIEGGFDASLLDRRATLEFSVYQKNITEMLLQRTLAPSTGFGVEIFNGGELRTRGVELGLGLVPIQTEKAEWVARVNFFRTHSEIVDLPVPAFRVGGFGTDLGAFEIAEGESPTQIVGNDSLPDGSVVVRKIGDATPDFNMSFTNDVSVGRFRLSALVDWQHGGSIINLTKFLYDLGQNTEDFADPITVGGQPTTVGQHRLEVFPKQTAVYLEDASFVKLREVTIAYEVPEDIVGRVLGAARSAQISLSGRNLLTFTDYTGLDPEVSNFGNQNIARNIDVAPFPPSRTFWFTVRVGF